MTKDKTQLDRVKEDLDYEYMAEESRWEVADAFFLFVVNALHEKREDFLRWWEKQRKDEK